MRSTPSGTGMSGPSAVMRPSSIRIAPPSNGVPSMGRTRPPTIANRPLPVVASNAISRPPNRAAPGWSGSRLKGSSDGRRSTSPRVLEPLPRRARSPSIRVRPVSSGAQDRAIADRAGGRGMLRTRLAIAALVTIVAAAGGITVGVVSAHRNAAALDRPATTVRAPATTVTPPTAPTTTIHGAGGTPTTGRTTDVTETTGTPTAPPRVPDPKVAARRLFDAWQEGDRKAALQVASPGAVRALFAVEPTPVPHFSNCRSRNLGFDCQYGYHQDSGLWFIVMRVEGGASAGYRVVSVEVNWRFTSPADAAKDLVDAWRANDRTAAHGASKAAVDAAGAPSAPASAKPSATAWSSWAGACSTPNPASPIAPPPAEAGGGEPPARCHRSLLAMG